MIYQTKTVPQGMDHIRCNQVRHNFSFKLPPKIDSDVDVFADELPTVAESKMREFIDRLEVVEARFSNNTRYINNLAATNAWDDWSREFWLTLESHEWFETHYLKAWIKYWLKIYEHTVKTKEPKLVEPPKTVFSDQDIVRAREYPIKDLFNGDLRHQYGKSMGLCPFHDESTPSFTIFDDNHFHCFGACGAHGDSIEFYMKLHNTSFIEAVKELCG